MAITRTAIVDDDGSQTTGSVWNNAWKTELYDQIDANVAAVAGDGLAWTTPTFSAGVFTGAGSQTWTVEAGDRITFAYSVVGKTLHLAVKVDTSTVGGTPNAVLQITLPASLLAARAMNHHCIANDNGTYAIALAQTAAGSGTLSLYRNISGSGSWAAATNTTGVFGTFIIEIQ